jgi:hypothetical protein
MARICDDLGFFNERADVLSRGLTGEQYLHVLHGGALLPAPRVRQRSLVRH